MLWFILRTSEKLQFFYVAVFCNYCTIKKKPKLEEIANNFQLLHIPDLFCICNEFYVMKGIHEA